MSERITAALAFCFLAGIGHAQTTMPASAPADRAALNKIAGPAMERAFDYLKGTQTADGSWKGPVPGTDPAITALIAKAFAQNPAYGPKHPITQRAIRFVLRHQQQDGGVYSVMAGFGNYSTSVALSAMAAMKDPALEKQIRAAQAYLKENQWTEGKRDADGKEIDASHPWYGGAGYGEHKRPDLSNTQMMLEALHDSGLAPDDPAFQKAMRFVARCQMTTTTNDQPFAQGARDGGFVYSPANAGESKAGKTDGGYLRSYGSMTYAGFKSMLYADLKRDDPRVRQAWDWIRRYYTLDANPNMPGAQSKEGLYYYYHVFGRALQAWGEPFVTPPTGPAHDWRRDLCEQLVRQQQPDGSWVNAADRWQEGNPYLVTAYSLLAMQAALADAPG